MNLAFVQNRHDRTICPMTTAAEGLQKLGYEVVRFNQEDADQIPVTRDTLVVGWIEVVRNAVLKVTGVKPPVLNYPDALKPFLGRKIWETTLGHIRNDPSLWPIFMKPAEDIKVFTGRLIERFSDLYGQTGLPNDLIVHASAPMKFHSEFRCFIQRGEVIGSRHYKGDPLEFPSGDKIRAMVAAWKDAPQAYCLDVGVVGDGWRDTRLVEINDAYSAGDYGLHPELYARFVEARWCELTGSRPIP